MYSIGMFAQLTGLTVKVLRFYDETGLLAPAEVDPRNGYRYYEPAQVRAAAMIAVLRGIGVPLGEVGEAVANPDRVEALVQAFADRRTEQRAREDECLAAGRELLADYDAPVEVVRRPAAPQPWVGFTRTLSMQAENTDEFDNEFDAFYHRAHRAGLEPVGYWWMEFAAESEDAETVRATACVPVTRLPEPGEESEVWPRMGTLPQRIEIVVPLVPSEASDALSAPHPSALALMEAGIDHDREVRQLIIRRGEDVALYLVADEAAAG